jgi:hypothetical protein
MGRHVWPGLAAYRVNDGSSSAFTMQEIPKQIQLVRARPQGTGQLLYNTTWTLKRNSGALASTLAGGLYQTRALIPASPWLDSAPPGAPALTLGTASLQLTPAAGEEPRWWAVRVQTASGWSTRVLFGSVRALLIESSMQRVLVQAVDQAGNVSAIAEWRRATS